LRRRRRRRSRRRRRRRRRMDWYVERRQDFVGNVGLKAGALTHEKGLDC
jgi:hypothetical protein